MANQQEKARGVPRGEAHHRSKLTDEIVQEIRASKERSTVLAARYGVTREAVSAVRRRRNWTHVPESQDARLERISTAVYESAKAEGATPVEAFCCAQGIYTAVRKNTSF